MKRYDVSNEDIVIAWKKGLTLNAIAREFKCSVAMVVNRLEKCGITDMHSHVAGANRHYDKEADKKWDEIKIDLDNGCNIAFLKKKYHMTKTRLLTLFKRHDYTFTKIKTQADKEREDLLRRLRAEGKTVREIAAAIGKSEHTVGRYLKQLGLTKAADRTDIDDKSVIKMFDDGYTIVEIANHFACSHDTITKRLNKVGITIDRETGIKKHFERTHDMLWTDIKADLDYGYQPNYISKKYKLRVDNVRRLMEKHNYTSTENILTDDLLAELMSHKVGASANCLKYIDVIESYCRTHNKAPSVKDIATRLHIQTQTVRLKIRKYGLCHFVRMVPLTDYVAQIVEDFDRLGIEYELNNRTVLRVNDEKTKELDIYVPSFKLGIEINPVYTHSTDTLYGVEHRNYHQTKTLLAEANGVGLLHMYDDDFFDKRKYAVFLNQFEARIKQRVKIGARNCCVKEISNSDSNLFLDKFHFQGAVNAKCVSYGLFYEDKLIGVMSVTKPRYTAHDYEILRYCQNPGYIVIGGFEKLFKTFLATLTTDASIVSYMDLNKRLSANNIYERSGFVFDRITDPDYAWYSLTENKILSRYMTTKTKLIQQGYDASKTEVEIMTERHFARVFRAGSKRYTYMHKI